MATQIQLRRGTAAQHASFTGAASEITFDTSNTTVRIHDGSTEGGFKLATEDRVNILVNDRMQVANVTAAVTAAVNNLVEAAPGALDTLNELAAAINDDANFATTITNSLATKASNSYVNSTFSTLNQLGNTNSYIANESVRIDVVNNNLTNTNTAIRTLVSDRLQVSNANITFVTKANAVSSNNAINARINATNANVDQKLGATASVTLTGDITGSASFSSNSVSIATDIASSGTPTGTFGSASKVPIITVGADGRITNISNTNVAGVTDFSYAAANNTFTISTADGGSFDATISELNDYALTSTVNATFSTLTQLGNTNSYIAVTQSNLDTQTARINLLNTNLTSTNTAIRSLVSATNANVDQKLGATASVTLTGDVTGSGSFSSNTVSIALTDTNLGNTNSYIATESARIDLINTNLTSTNTAIRSLISATNANVDQKLGATAAVTLTGAVTGSANFSGNSVSITTTATSDPTITLGGDLTGSVTLTNLGNGTLTAAVVDDSHNHSSSSGAFIVGTDLTVSGGDIILSGTGRIQGIDTVSAGTDAASKTYVDNAVAGVVDSAPEALNTLNELAAALGDDANFATTTATTLGTKAANTYVNATFSTLTQLGNTNSYIATKADATTQVIAGSGLTGGGTLAANRTLNIGAGTGITVAADSISTNDGAIVHDNLSGFVANEHIDHSTVSVTAGSGLTGGGTIAATRTINIGQGTGISVAADAISTNDSQIVHDNLSGFVADEHIAHSGVTLTAGNGLTGGGTIAASRTFAVGAGTLIDVTADAVNVDLSELSTSTTDGDGDYFVVVDTANAQRKLTKANINISGFNNDAGYSTTTGTVTSVGVTAGTGLSGGGTVTTSGTISLAVDLSELTDMTAGMVGTDEFIVLDAGADRRKAANEIGLSIFNNDAGFQTSAGSVASATNATNATNFNVAADNATNATHYPIFTGGATGNQRPNSDTGLTYNPSTGILASVDFNSTSDERLKENIQTLENASEKVNQLRGVSFDWKESGLSSIGLIAQEVEKVIPEVVAETDGTKSISYGSLVGLLIEAIKDQQKQINELKQIINNV